MVNGYAHQELHASSIDSKCYKGEEVTSLSALLWFYLEIIFDILISFKMIAVPISLEEIKQSLKNFGFSIASQIIGEDDRILSQTLSTRTYVLVHGQRHVKQAAVEKCLRKWQQPSIFTGF